MLRSVHPAIVQIKIHLFEWCFKLNCANCGSIKCLFFSSCLPVAVVWRIRSALQDASWRGWKWMEEEDIRHQRTLWFQRSTWNVSLHCTCGTRMRPDYQVGNGTIRPQTSLTGCQLVHWIVGQYFSKGVNWIGFIKVLDGRLCGLNWSSIVGLSVGPILEDTFNEVCFLSILYFLILLIIYMMYKLHYQTGSWLVSEFLKPNSEAAMCRLASSTSFTSCWRNQGVKRAITHSSSHAARLQNFSLDTVLCRVLPPHSPVFPARVCSKKYKTISKGLQLSFMDWLVNAK